MRLIDLEVLKMTRYLLYDSKCSVCTNLANNIKEATDGWLKVASLSDPHIRQLLKRAGSEHLWEPTLLVKSTSGWKTYTGAKMKVYIAQNLGLRKSLELNKLVRSINTPEKFATNRRNFLRKIGVTISHTIIATPFLNILYKSPLDENTNTLNSELIENELTDNMKLVAGFLILPDTEFIPSFVRPPRNGFPLLCGVGGTEPTATTEFPVNIKDLAERSQIPIVSINEINPESMETFSSYIVFYKHSGEVFSVSHQLIHPELKTQITFSIRTNFSDPYPIMIPTPVEKGRSSITVHEANYLPENGLEIQTEYESQLTWIQNNLLYSVMFKDNVDSEELRRFSHKLQRVN